MQKIILSQSLNRDLTAAISECGHDNLFILTDEKTAQACLPVIQRYRCLRNARHITVPQGDTNKNLRCRSLCYFEHNQITFNFRLC